MSRQIILTFMLILFSVSLSIPENFVDLLNELNGTHLRFSAHPVSLFILVTKKKFKFYFLNFKYRFPICSQSVKTATELLFMKVLPPKLLNSSHMR